MHKSILILFLMLSGLGFTYSQNVVYESITYLKSDGRSFSQYSNLKSGYSTIYTYIPKGKKPINYYQYIFPNNYRFEKFNHTDLNKIHFNGGDYSMIIDDVLSNEQLSIDENGVYTFKMPKKVVDGYYGLHWNSPNRSGFTELAYVWIIPEEFEFVSYDSNKSGEWVERDNSLSFFGSRINNVLLEIRYRKKEKTPDSFQNRQISVKKRMVLNGRTQTLKIRDNGQEDGDIISVSLNGEWIIKGLKVTKKEVEIALNLRKGNNYLIMHAENEGSIPPNTAAMKLGEEEIILNSSADSSEALELYVN